MYCVWTRPVRDIREHWRSCCLNPSQWHSRNSSGQRAILEIVAPKFDNFRIPNRLPAKNKKKKKKGLTKWNCTWSVSCDGNWGKILEPYCIFHIWPKDRNGKNSPITLYVNDFNPIILTHVVALMMLPTDRHLKECSLDIHWRVSLTRFSTTKEATFNDRKRHPHTHPSSPAHLSFLTLAISHLLRPNFLGTSPRQTVSVLGSAESWNSRPLEDPFG